MKHVSLALIALAIGYAAPAQAQMVGSRQPAEVTPYQARQVAPYQARSIAPVQANGVQPVTSGAIQPYQAHAIKVFSPAEREAMRRNDMRGYPTGGQTKGRQLSRGKRARAGMTAAQVEAYGVLNHNVGVWYSGQDFKPKEGQ